ncbi:hypothetical protein KSS87_017959, partial [Heliosperma pusillum]
MQTMDKIGTLTQGVTMQTKVNVGRKTHCSHKELQSKQWVVKHDKRYFV